MMCVCVCVKFKSHHHHDRAASECVYVARIENWGRRDEFTKRNICDLHDDNAQSVCIKCQNMLIQLEASRTIASCVTKPTGILVQCYCNASLNPYMHQMQTYHLI